MENRLVEKIGELTLLYDFYGELLTARQRETMSLFLEEDYSLGEIASSLHITRQAAHDAIKKSEKLLYGYEEKLGLAKRFLQVKRLVKEAEHCIEQAMQAESMEKLPEALRLLEQIVEE